MLENRSLTCLILLKIFLFVTGDHYDLRRETWIGTSKNKENFTVSFFLLFKCIINCHK